MGKRGAVYGKQFTFLYTSPYEHVKYNVWSPWVGYFRVWKIFRKKISTIIFVVKGLKGFDWNNVGPASQTVAQYYFTIGLMYRVYPGSGLSGDERSPVWQSEQTRDNHPILLHCWASVEYDWLALNQRWVATLAQHLTGIGWEGVHCVYQVHRIDAYTDLSAMVVEGIGLHVEDIPVSLVLSIIIPCKFLTHEENQYSYVYNANIRPFFVSKALKQTKAGTPFLVFFFSISLLTHISKDTAQRCKK